MAQIGKVIKGLQILAKYTPEGEETHLGGAEHDIIHGAAFETEVSSDDAQLLEDAGWFKDKYEGWACFV